MADAMDLGDEYRARVPEEWQELRFSTYLPDGSKKELLPGGDTLPVNLGNWRDYVSLMEVTRLKESAIMLKAFRNGLAAVLPVELLPLFTAREIEEVIVDIAMSIWIYLKGAPSMMTSTPRERRHATSGGLLMDSTTKKERFFYASCGRAAVFPRVCKALICIFACKDLRGPPRKLRTEIAIYLMRKRASSLCLCQIIARMIA